MCKKKISLYEVIFGTVFLMRNIDNKILKIKSKGSLGSTLTKELEIMDYLKILLE